MPKTKLKARPKAKVRKTTRRVTPAASGSVIPAGYVARYKATGDADDEFARLFRERVPKGKLREFAEANALWNARYETLNQGMVAMGVRNKGRARFKRGEALKWPK